MPQALALSCFAGLPILGLESQGLDVAAHLGTSSYGLATSELNFPDIPTASSTDAWEDVIEERVKDPSDLLVFCQPECAVWSSAGKSHGSRDGWREDPRLANFHSCVNQILSLRPKVAFIESVPNAYKNARPLMVDFASRAKDHGLSTTFLFVNGAHHGLPQTRKRFFLVLHQGAFRVAPPLVTRLATCGDAIDSVSDPGPFTELQPFTLKNIDKIRPGNEASPFNVWRKMAEAGEITEERHVFPSGKSRVVGRPRMFEARLPQNGQMGAFIGDFYIHPKLPRRIGVNEAKALNCVPQSYKLAGGWRGHLSLLARSVMPPVAAWAAEQALANWDSAALNYPEANYIDLRTKGSLFL